MTNHTSSSSGIRQSGFSLVELMVAITLGLLILAGLSAVFVNSSRARNEVELAGQQIENGRYAMQVLTQDLRNAGYLAEFDPRVLSTPTSKPDACATALADLKSSLPLHIQGYDNVTSAPSSCSTYLSDIRSTLPTDILVVRRASTCAAGTTNCASTAGFPYFQASLCNPGTAGLGAAAAGTELASASTDYSTSYYALDTDAANLTRHQRDCSNPADKHRYLTHIYFIANNDNAGDGIPTLKRAELGVTESGATTFTIFPIAEGIENLQIEYGIDTNCDGTPDTYTADPDGLAAPACSVKSGATPVVMDNWRNVVAVKVHLLARNTNITAGYTDEKTYVLGDNPPVSFSGVDAKYKRHVFQSMVRLNNPAGRSATP